MKVKPEESSSTTDVSQEEIKTENDEMENKEEKYVEPEPVDMEVELIR